VTERSGRGQSPDEMLSAARPSPPESAIAPDLASRPPGPEFAAAYREHHDFVWRILRYFGVPSAVLDDKVQDVFLVAYRRWSDLDPTASQRSWLFGIARRVAADLRRSTVRAERRLQAVPAPTDGPGPDQLLAQAEAAAFVDSFLKDLDEDKRTVFMLAEIERLTAPEIAEATGAKLNTVYSRLRAARALFEAAARDFTSNRHRDPRRTHVER
jgi:RNA polymerase sigma factor (sigma-70 family)